MKYPFQYREKTIVGLIESDGTFGMRITKRKNNKIGCSYSIFFEAIKRTLGDGYVGVKPKGNVCVLKISGVSKVQTLVHIYMTNTFCQKQSNSSSYFMIAKELVILFLVVFTIPNHIYDSKQF
jgi:hypothetical protein